MMAANNISESEQSLTSITTPPTISVQTLITTKPVIHRAEAGINPIVDAAAYLFSITGKLKYVKFHNHLSNLHQELIKEIKEFQDTIQTYAYTTANYLEEYVLISTYILCVTLDDVIAATPWGSQEQWDHYSLVAYFKQEPLSHKGFLIILERLIQDPTTYIDMMEFIFICLNLGFKCRNPHGEFNHEELSQISNALYKHIRAYRGNFSKTLSPFSIKSTTSHTQANKSSAWLTLPLTNGFSTALLYWQKLFNRK
ncbi:MAG TPA: type IVB secretion system protein IcmH/DotU [Gammaproteobacteria bacterium]|nr:type IVB secretion system protein IcmH/DotU [Gammaproteobacteria bacterium]